VAPLKPWEACGQVIHNGHKRYVALLPHWYRVLN